MHCERSRMEVGIIENSQSSVAPMSPGRRLFSIPRGTLLAAPNRWGMFASMALLCTAMCILQGCQSAVQGIRNQPESVLDAAFSEIFLTREMSELEAHILARVQASPIEAGAPASALLELDAHSLVAHYGLAAFYDAVDELDSATRHRQLAEQAAQRVEQVDGRHVLASPAQAEAYVAVLGYKCIGRHYPPTAPLAYHLLALADDGINHHFEFLIARPQLLAPEGVDIDLGRFEDLWLLMLERSRMGDSAARSFVREIYFAHQNSGARLPDWFLNLPNSTPNVYLDLWRGIASQNLAVHSDGEARLDALEDAERQYRRAATLGSTRAKWRLGRLYRSRELGLDKAREALQLYREAATARDLDATRDFARLLEWGEPPFGPDLDAARTQYRNAWLWGDSGDLRRYIDFLRRSERAVAFDPGALEALRTLADEDHAWSLITLGNLYADGVGVKTNYRRARKLLRDAAREAPEEPDLINEVAWVLSTSNKSELRDDRFALRIMDHMMSANEQARQNPMFLDTWAATYAANDDFDVAVRLQRQALEAADLVSLEASLLAEMREHLEYFNQGEALSKELFGGDERDIREGPQDR